MQRKYLTHLLIAAILGFSGCAASDPVPPPMKLTRGESVPVVHLKDFSGNTRTLQDFKGRPFILTFWAPWCAMCIAEMPSLVKLRNDFKDEPLEVVAVGVESSQEDLEEGVAKYDLPFTVLMDTKEEAADAFNIRALPISFVVDGNGRIVDFPDPFTGVPSKRIEGPREWSKYETVRAIESLKSE